jgi:hypothetical protein
VFWKFLEFDRAGKLLTQARARKCSGKMPEKEESKQENCTLSLRVKTDFRTLNNPLYIFPPPQGASLFGAILETS